MKIKVAKNLLLGLSSVIVGTAMAANQVTLVNGSPSPRKPLEVIYQIAHKNPGQPTVLGKTEKIMLLDKAVIPMDLKGYALAGLVAVSIGGHQLPDSTNKFDVAKQCSVAVSAKQTQAMMMISLYPHKAICVVKDNA